MKNIELAKWLHDNYEQVAWEKDWDTQESCKVEFDTLPTENKQVMIEIAERLLNFDLLRLHLVSKSFTEKQMDDAYDKGYSDCLKNKAC